MTNGGEPSSKAESSATAMDSITDLEWGLSCLEWESHLGLVQQLLHSTPAANPVFASRDLTD